MLPNRTPSSFAVGKAFFFVLFIASLSLNVLLGGEIFRQQHNTAVLAEKSQSVRVVTPSPFTTPTLIPSATPTASPSPKIVTKSNGFGKTSWAIQSVSSMKETKDRVCNPRSQAFITQWMRTAKELGANYVAIETPYDSPGCGNAAIYTKAWVIAARLQGLHVWHRHMPLAFEGIYDTPKTTTGDYLALIANYIATHASDFQPGDIFTPIPEPQNGGIAGVTYCAQNLCQFPSKEQFNSWLRSAMTTAEKAFTEIGLAGQIKIGYFGFDGFIAWGDNNPDWKGILEEATIHQMGNITIDHYAEKVGDTMANDLNELQARYPAVPIVIGEWGTISGSNPEEQVLATMQAAKRPGVVGFNYWHMGVGGNEALINEDFSHRSQFDEVRRFYTGSGI